MSVNPMQRTRVINAASVSIKPHIHVVLDANFLFWYKPLKHDVDVLICDDRQCGVPAFTQRFRIIPTQHWTVRVETIFLIVHWIALGEGIYDVYGVEQNQHTSCRKSTCIVADFIALWQFCQPQSPGWTYPVWQREIFSYRAMLRSESAVMRLCRLSVRPSVCNVQVRWSHRLEYFESSFTAE